MGTKLKIENVGKRGTITLGELTIEVEIIDYKNSYGHDRWLVKPVAGSGQTWTEQAVIRSI